MRKTKLLLPLSERVPLQGGLVTVCLRAATPPAGRWIRPQWCLKAGQI